MVRVNTGDTVTFRKCRSYSGKVETIIDKGNPGEFYIVIMPDGKPETVKKSEIESAVIFRSTKVSKPKIKKGCGCK